MGSVWKRGRGCQVRGSLNFLLFVRYQKSFQAHEGNLSSEWDEKKVLVWLKILDSKVWPPAPKLAFQTGEQPAVARNMK